MQKLIQEQVAKIELMKKLETPWEADQPWPQKYHTFQDGRWITIDSRSHQPGEKLNELILYSWNIDFMLPYPESRMRKAIECLKSLISQQSAATASVIFLQETLQSDINLLASIPWIQETFYLSDLDAENWTSAYYGTITLVDKRLQVKESFRVHYSQTVMERDAFFTDIVVGGQNEIVRLCNSHLESLALEPPRRPFQVKICAAYMLQEGVHAAAMAGDFNAIQDFDRSLHKDNGLQDAYLVLGGQEDSDNGYTWGQQAPTYQRDMFGCSRMDKVFFSGNLRLQSFERFGAGIEVEDETERTGLVELGFDKPWITDHLGVMARFEVVGSKDRASSI